ncbi:thiamine phosphate synthase [Candidatus Marinamargulisbacteria bacterium SCGC AG-333-B06]|nr:thiamine phosphate synthase [Candidatus Marinamargulisbacteria bacterium SCGC AG-333-B06]
MFNQIIDANINRASEGLRVIEEYVRFIAKHKNYTDQLSGIRKKLNKCIPQTASLLSIRNTEQDMRAKEKPEKRESIHHVLTANFKRIQESLRVLEEYTGDVIFNECRYDIYELEKNISLSALKKEIKPGIYLISDDPSILKQGIAWGVSMIQLRDKHATKEELYQKAKEIKECNSTIPFVLNDYLDIVHALDLDGLHTGQDDINISIQRKILGPHKIIGRTTHTITQGKEAEQAGADYVSIGPIWETPSKPGRKAIGYDYLKKARLKLTIPYVAIGGINYDSITKIIEHQAPLIGLIRGYKEIPKILKLLETY